MAKENEQLKARRIPGVSFRSSNRGTGAEVARLTEKELSSGHSRQRPEAIPYLDNAIEFARNLGKMHGERQRVELAVIGHFDDEGGNVSIKLRVFTDAQTAPFGTSPE